MPVKTAHALEAPSSRNGNGTADHCHGEHGRDHFVQFYENDTTLVQSVARFIGGGLGAGEGAVVIATPEHRAAIAEQLTEQGVDLAKVQARGHYIALDATETLSTFMVNGSPDAARFHKIVGELVRKSGTGRSGVRAFGEMVALLWAEGNGAAAIRLEELWNELGKEQCFCLFCAYPLNGFRDAACGHDFRQICDTHSRVLPSEEFLSRNADQRLQEIAVLQQKARALETEILDKRRAEEKLRDSEQRLRQFLSLMPSAVYACDRDGRITYYNRRAAELWGREPVLGDEDQKFCGALRLWLSNGSPLPHADTPMAVAVRQGTPCRDREVTVERPDGSRVTVGVNIDPIRDDAGSLCGAINVFQDITDRKRAEEKLRDSEQRLRQLLSLMPSAVYACDREGRITYFNRRAVELWGREPELNGSERFCACYKVFLPDGTLLPPHQTPMAAAVQEGKSFRNVEAAVERPDGSRFVASVNVDPIRDDAGNLCGAINVFQDITERKGAEDELRKRSERLELLSDTLAQLLEAGDPDSIVRELFPKVAAHLGVDTYFNFMVNPEGDALTLHSCAGISEETARGIKRLEFGQAICGTVAQTRQSIHATDIQRSGYDKAALVRGFGIQCYACNPLIVGDRLLGTLSFASRTRTAFHPDELQFLRIVSQYAAVTLDRLQQSRAAARLAAIVEHSDDAILSIDFDTTIQSWNRGAQRLFGYSANEVIGRPVNLLIPPDRDDEEPGIINRIRAGEVVENYETLRLRKDGTTLNVSLTVSPIKDAEGNVIGASKVVRDITDKVRARETLEHIVAERTAQLRDTVAELEAFSYSVAHDMRAPLRAMNSYSRFLQEDFANVLPPEGKDFTRRIANGAQRLDALITDVLNYSKIARAEMPLETVDVEKLTREIVDSYPHLRESGASILVESGIPPVIGNAAAITQCISNLLSNAVKFVTPGLRPRVLVRAEKNGGFVRLWFEDNGIGISQEGQQRIFRLFQRLNPVSEFEGAGIGLTIVRKAVERMGGRIGVESEPGAGSRFWIELKSA